MPERHPLDFLADCADVPLECNECHALFTLGGNPAIWAKDEPPTEEEIAADLCSCNAGFRVYVGDAPTEAADRLAMLLDVIDSMTPEERDGWVQNVRDDLSAD